MFPTFVSAGSEHAEDGRMSLQSVDLRVTKSDVICELVKGKHLFTLNLKSRQNK